MSLLSSWNTSIRTNKLETLEVTRASTHRLKEHKKRKMGISMTMAIFLMEILNNNLRVVRE